MATQTLPASGQSQTLPVPVLINFLSVVPVPLTTVLVELAPLISRIRRAAEIISWRSSWVDSWLALAAWWAACLLADSGLRYLLPIAILFTFAVIRWTTRPRIARQPITEQNLEDIVSDLNIIKDLLPTSPPVPELSPLLLRIAFILYVPYLLLTIFVRLRLLVGIAGTVVLSWRAPWARFIRRTLWRSAWIRWSMYHIWSILAGEPLPPMTLSAEPKPTSPQPYKDIRFLFTIYENQRWWMGLDWTAALLPSERPSWCSHTHDPVSPPSAYTLPDSTTVYLKDGKGGRVKRTAMWRWEEGEWSVIVNKDGRAARVEKPLPSANPELVTGIKLSKLGKTREASQESAEGSSSSPRFARAEDQEASIDDPSGVEPEEPPTDADGWVYSDNKWEAPSGSNRLGKFTRYRRWSRVAVVSEVIEVVEPGEVGIEAPSPDDATFDGREVQSPISAGGSSTSQTHPTEGDVDDASQPTGKRATLRQRMQNSLRKGQIPIANAS